MATRPGQQQQHKGKGRARRTQQADHGEAAGLAILAEIDRRAISSYELSKLAGVNPSIVQRFISGARRDLRLATASRIVAALGGRIVFDRGRRGSGAGSSASTRPAAIVTVEIEAVTETPVIPGVQGDSP